MNPKMLLPVLIALHLAAAALIVDGLGLGAEEQESARHNRAWQVVEWNPGPDCVAGHANDDLARYWSSEYRQLNAMGTDQRDCVNIH
ncbi:MAG: hypothetical protein HY067_03790 [Betaproteobacteria bacterium]|nr:hypothetical protein [Betaproteobacteria bacterium]